MFAVRSCWQIEPETTVEVLSNQSAVKVIGVPGVAGKAVFEADAKWDISTGTRQDTGFPSIGKKAKHTDT